MVGLLVYGHVITKFSWMDSFSSLRDSAITNEGPQTNLMTSDLLIPFSNDILQISQLPL